MKKRLVASSLILLGMAGGQSLSAPILQVKGEASESLLALDAGFLDALESAGIKTTPVRPAKMQSKKPDVRLPVSGGVTLRQSWQRL